MKSVKLTFGSLVLVAMLVVSLVSSGFSQTVLAGNITIKAHPIWTMRKYTV